MKVRWEKFLKFAIPYRSDFLWVGVLMLAAIALNALAPWPLKLIVDYVLNDRPLPAVTGSLNQFPGADSPAGLLAWLATLTLIIFIFKQLASVLQAFLQMGAASRMKFDLGAQVFNHLQNMSLRFHGKQRTGDLMRRVTADSACVQEIVTQILIPTISATLTLLVMFSIMWQLDYTTALLALVVVIPMPFLIRHLSPRMFERSYKEQMALSELMAVAEQTMSSLPVVQAFGREPEQSRQFKGVAAQAIESNLRTIVAQLQYKFGVSGAMAFGNAAVMIFAGTRTLEGVITIGDLLVIMSYLAAIYQPLETLAYLPSNYAHTASRAQRVQEILDFGSDIRDAPNARELNADDQNNGLPVKFEDVCFSYEAEQSVLKDISFDVSPGETIALIGPSGAGKSTLVSLIPRFFDPDTGRVLINGTDIRQLTLKGLRNHISIVLQDPFLLPISIKENIAYGRPSASEQEIEEAAIAANAHEFIKKLPDGYQTEIGERGATLSGGQRQRLAIARALLKNAPILILDEPSSALDAQTEALLLDALRRLVVNRTTFIIAHRMATIRDADRVFELADGKLHACRSSTEVDQKHFREG